MENWASKELEHVELGDARRNKRLVRIVEDLASQPTSSVPQACGSLAAACAAYDFWSSPYFSPDDIRDGHIKSTIERVKEHNIVLMIQDTTNLDYTTHRATSKLGYLDNRNCFGLKVHSTFAASIEGIPLGVVNQQVWARDIEDARNSKETT